jgi:hypothetical protein
MQQMLIVKVQAIKILFNKADSTSSCVDDALFSDVTTRRRVR